MPLIYDPSTDTTYEVGVSNDLLGNPQSYKYPVGKGNLTGQNPTPGHTTSSNVSQSFADPQQLAIERTRVQNEIQQTQNALQIATANRDENARQFNQKRLDDLYQYQNDLTFKYAQLDQSANEGALTREQQAQLKAIDAALSASQFASTYGLSVAQQQQQQQRDALAAANQFANLISSTDTAALPAFYKAGGGIIANALAGGKTALSDNALLPAARTLRAIATPVAAPPAFNPNLYSPSMFAPASAGGGVPFTPVFTPRQTQIPVRPPIIPPVAAAPIDYSGSVGPATGVANPLARPGTPAWVTGEAAPPPPAPSQPAPTAPDPGLQWDAGSGYAYGTANPPIQRYADGSVPAGMHTQFMAGDSTSPNPAAGGAHPEGVEINDPTGDATFKVNPLTTPGTGDTDGTVGSLLSAIGAFLQANEEKPGPVMAPMADMMRHAYGTGMMDARYAYGTDPSGIAPEDLPFLDQVRQLRQSQDVTPPIAGGYFNVGYQNVAPSLRAAYANSFQTRYGIPTTDITAEANRFAVPGLDRNSFTSGYGGGAKQEL